VVRIYWAVRMNFERTSLKFNKRMKKIRNFVPTLVLAFERIYVLYRKREIELSLHEVKIKRLRQQGIKNYKRP